MRLLPPAGARDAEVAAFLKQKYPNTITKYIKNLNFNTREVSHDIKTIRSQGGEIGCLSMHAYMNILRGSRYFVTSELDNYLKEGRKVNSDIMKSLLHTLAMKGDVKTMYKYFKLMRKHRVACKPDHASLVIRCFAIRGDHRRALQILVLMNNPNFSCYARALETPQPSQTALSTLAFAFADSRIKLSDDDSLALVCLTIRNCNSTKEVRSLLRRYGSLITPQNSMLVRKSILVYHSRCSQWRVFRDYLELVLSFSEEIPFDYSSLFLEALTRELQCEVFRATVDVMRVESLTSVAERFVYSIFIHNELRHRHIVQMLRLYRVIKDRDAALTFIKWILDQQDIGCTASMVEIFDTIPGPSSSSKMLRFT
eukprot:TRINITY_DN11984_c0_g1_i1.p1 TRINITY_DN11984_c0_g1~~TRINITY_DN11984_c0_g1_i1.p1  ORF type:complete len:369 (+),score=26.28 TRINITY_DN11984_c0_g1_i1:59-1165(+)